MNETEQDIHPLGDGGRFNPVAAAKVLARVLAIVVPTLLGAIASYHKATSDAGVDAKVQVQTSKDKAEAGYQVTSHALEALEHRVLVLEQTAARQTAARKVVVHGPRPAPPAALVVPRPVPPLPPNLDQAAKQIAKAPPAPPPGPALDGGAPSR